MDAKNERRQVLRFLVAGGCAAATGLPGFLACSGSGDADVSAVKIDRLEARRSGRSVVHWRGQPVEVRFTGEAFEARSLVCPHMGCVVRWEAQERRYFCPCHEGIFDADGEPVAGPPNHPLTRVAVQVSENELIVGS